MACHNLGSNQVHSSHLKFITPRTPLEVTNTWTFTGLSRSTFQTVFAWDRKNKLVMSLERTTCEVENMHATLGTQNQVIRKWHHRFTSNFSALLLNWKTKWCTRPHANKVRTCMQNDMTNHCITNSKCLSSWTATLIIRNILFIHLLGPEASAA